MAGKNQGGAKLPNFTPEQVQQLRLAAKHYMMRNGLSEPALAERLDIAQQSVNRFLNHGGFTYVTATKLVDLAGYDGVDDFFRQKGVALEAKSKIPGIGKLKDPVSNDRRETGMRYARASGVTEQVIRMVNAEEGEANHPERVWTTKYQQRQRLVEEERRKS